MIARLNHRVKRLEDEYDAHWAFKVCCAFFYTHPRRLDIALGIDVRVDPFYLPRRNMSEMSLM